MLISNRRCRCRAAVGPIALIVAGLVAGAACGTRTSAPAAKPGIAALAATQPARAGDEIGRRSAVPTSTPAPAAGAGRQAPVSGVGAAAALPTATALGSGRRFEQLLPQYPGIDATILSRDADSLLGKRVSVTGTVVATVPISGQRQKVGVLTLLQPEGTSAATALVALHSDQPLAGIEPGARLRVLGEASGRWPMAAPGTGERISPPLVFVDAFAVG